MAPRAIISSPYRLRIRAIPIIGYIPAESSLYKGPLLFTVFYLQTEKDAEQKAAQDNPANQEGLPYIENLIEIQWGYLEKDQPRADLF